jgi:hypothetical protein
MITKEEPWHRRHAVMLAGQLPDGQGDALLVLELAIKLVREFLVEPEIEKKLAPVVTLFRAPGCAGG